MWITFETIIVKGNKMPKSSAIYVCKASLVAAAIVLQACGTSVSVFPDLVIEGFETCEKTTKLSLIGSCTEQYISQRQPNWTQEPRAQFLSTLFTYVNRAGEKVERGEWNRTKYEYELSSFINRIKIQEAQNTRAANSAAIDSFVKGLNSGITCINFGPGMVQCR